MASISVIIPSYNHSAFISEAIESVLSQSVQVAEIIIVDDCSVDNTLDVIRQFKDKRIHLIKNARNQGGAETLNIGIRCASSEWIAICNSDDVWEKEKLKIQLDNADQFPDTVAFFFRCVIH